MMRWKLGCFLVLAVTIAVLFVFGPLAPAASYFFSWASRVFFPTDRVIVLNGHGFRVPAAYPGFNYGGATGGLATAVLWPSMEPWTPKATEGIASNTCATLELHLGASDIGNLLKIEDQFFKNNSTIKKHFVPAGMKNGLEFIDEYWSDKKKYEIYLNKKGDNIDFIAQCSPIGRSINQMCRVVEKYKDNITITIEVVPIDCLKDWMKLRDVTVNLFSYFEDLYAERG